MNVKSLLEEENLIKSLAISLTIMVCLTRLSMAAGTVFYVISILLGLVLWYKYRHFSLNRESKEYAMAVLIFFASLIPSIIFSESIVDSAKSFVNDFIYRFFVFILILGFIKKREYIVNMLTAFIGVTCIDCLVALYQLLTNYTHRPWGFGSNPLTLAAVMIMLAPISLIFLLDASLDKKLKRVATAFLPCLIIGLLSNKSRSSWLFIPIVALPVLWQYVRQNKKYLCVLLATVACLGTFFTVNPAYKTRLISITNTTTDYSNIDRIEAWYSSWEMFKDYPLTGVGLGDWRSVHEGQYRGVRNTQNLPHAHNEYFQILSEAGIAGFLGFLYFCAFFNYKSFSNWLQDKNPYDLLIFCTSLGYLILFSIIEHAMDNSSGIRIFWFLVACFLQLKGLTGDNHEENY